MDLLTDLELLNDIKASSDSIRQRNVLKQVNNLLKSLLSHDEDETSIHQFISIFFEGRVLIKNDDVDPIDHQTNRVDNCHSLGYILLYVISDDEAVELCRERAANCLRDCFKVMLSLSTIEGAFINIGMKGGFLTDFYTDFCFILAERFGIAKHNFANDNFNYDEYQNSLLKKKMDGINKQSRYEKSEEIRLLLIQAMSAVLELVQCSILGSGEDDRNDIESLILPSNLICQVLGKSALLDSYPELKRESSNLLKLLADMVPIAVKMNEECLLDSILGPEKDSFNNTMNMDHKQQTKNQYLILHRHAKTRSLALEAVADIMRCHGMYNRASVKHVKTSSVKEEEDGESSALLDILATKVIPCLETRIPFDHSASVRGALAITVGKLLHQIIEHSSTSSTSYTVPLSNLTLLLLIGASDEVEVVKHKSLTQLTKCAEAFCVANGIIIDENDDDDHSSDLTAIFIGTSFMDLVTAMLQRISRNSSIQSSRRYFETLAATIKITSHNIDTNIVPSGIWRNHVLLTKIISTICCSLLENDDEQSLFEAALACANSLGSVSYARQSILQIMEASLNKEDNNNDIALLEVEELVSTTATMTVQNTDSNVKLIFSSAQQCASAVNLIGGLVQGWYQYESNDTKKTSPNRRDDMDELRTTIRLLGCKKVIQSAHLSQDAAIALLSSCHSLTNFAIFESSSKKVDICKSDEFICNLTWCCVNLIACPNDFNVSELALNILKMLATRLPEVGSYTELLDLNFELILSKLTSNARNVCWSRGDQNLNTFDALVRTSHGSTLAANLDTLLPLFESHLAQKSLRGHNDEHGHDKDQVVGQFSTKIYFMALVESIVSKPSLPRHDFFPFVERILDTVVVPNLVWQVGGMASALRKVSAAVLFSILRGNCITDEIIFRVAPRLFSIVKANLSDDDSSLRELSISSMKLLLERLPNRLGEEALHDLYPELMKCLDDSFDSVRLETCDALKHFFKCSSRSNYDTAILSYICEQLFVHLDDPNPALKEKVFEVLVVLLDIDKKHVIKGAKSSLSSHSCRHHCDLLLEFASEERN